MQAIITKFLGPTNTKGSRIKATSWDASVTVTYNYALDSLNNHRAAADAVCASMGDEWKIVASALMPDGHGYAFTTEYDPE